MNCCDKCIERGFYEGEQYCVLPICPCHSPAKDQKSVFPFDAIMQAIPAVADSLEESVSGEERNILCQCFCHRLGMLAPGKRYQGSCSHCEEQPQPEWEQSTMSFAKKYGMGVDQTDELFTLLRTQTRKEYERGREERAGEMQATIERQVRNDTLDGVEKIVEELGGKTRVVLLRFLLPRLKALKS